MPPDDRPEEVTTIDQDLTVSETVLDFADNDEASPDDYFRIGDECIKIVSTETSGEKVIERGVLGTNAETHTDGDPALKFNRKFFIKGMDYSPMSLDWRLTAEALPE